MAVPAASNPALFPFGTPASTLSGGSAPVRTLDAVRDLASSNPFAGARNLTSYQGSDLLTNTHTNRANARVNISCVNGHFAAGEIKEYDTVNPMEIVFLYNVNKNKTGVKRKSGWATNMPELPSHHLAVPRAWRSLSAVNRHLLIHRAEFNDPSDFLAKFGNPMGVVESVSTNSSEIKAGIRQTAFATTISGWVTVKDYWFEEKDVGQFLDLELRSVPIATLPGAAQVSNTTVAGSLYGKDGVQQLAASATASSSTAAPPPKIETKYAPPPPGVGAAAPTPAPAPAAQQPTPKKAKLEVHLPAYLSNTFIHRSVGDPYTLMQPEVAIATLAKDTCFQVVPVVRPYASNVKTYDEMNRISDQPIIRWPFAIVKSGNSNMGAGHADHLTVTRHNVNGKMLAQPGDGLYSQYYKPTPIIDALLLTMLAVHS